MPANFAVQAPMEVLSPRSANIPPKPRTMMKKSKQEVKPRVEEKPTNPDRIDDRWRPPSTVTEPGDEPKTYAVGKKLGKGGFAVCFEGKRSVSPRGAATAAVTEIFALKVVKAHVQQKKMMEKFRTEMQIHAKMRHPNIVEFHRAFTLEGHTYVVLELCENGSLTDMVKARSCLSLPEVRRFMIQICGGVKYLHRRSVIHRDLKMGNIFLDSKLNLKIGDFGLAAVMADDQDRRTTLCGTPNYIAPEILSKSGTRGHDYKVDTWAIGVICYAMLMGTPPFQSRTQQEIYTKLKTLEYEWKVDSINYIPQEAKDCVASCLNLTAADRPDMDELVEDRFFKTGAIADVLDLSCLQSKPTWLTNADPKGDRVRHGYGMSHARICSECGVGRAEVGTLRASVGAKANVSALVEIEIENRHGTAPVTPLPEGLLYKQFIEAVSEKTTLVSTKIRGRRPVEEVLAMSMAVDSAGAVPPPQPSMSLPQRLASSTRPTQSFAAQQRQQALPRSTMPRNDDPVKELNVSGAEIINNKTSEVQGLLKARPVRSTSTRSTRNLQSQDGSLPKMSATLAEPKTVSERTIPDTGPHGEELASGHALRTRPRSLRSNPSRPLSAASIPSSDSDTGVSSATSETAKEQPVARPHSAIVPLDAEDAHHRKLPSGTKVRTVFKSRLIGEAEPYTLLPELSHARITKSLRDLYLSLGLTGYSTKPTPNSRSLHPHSRVDKWVDYATKHGIAYILSEGSLGMILKSSRANAAASSCVVVRSARRHTVHRAQGLEFQFVPQGRAASDVEFYEQVDSEHDMKRLDVEPGEFELDLRTHSSQVSAATALLNNLTGSAAQRMKEVGLLDKFGKYMNKQMGSSDYSDTKSTDDAGQGHLIHFYQRMGNVGCWRFADGAMQFNFPDHTKLVLYQSESMALDDDAYVDVVYLDPSDALELSTRGVLTNETLERRGLRTLRLSDIRNDCLRRSEMEIVRSNEIKEKLSWIRGVIGCWIKEGGLGWTGEEKLGWSGLQEKRDDKRVKLQWVTVGRPGGDEDVSTKS